MLRVLPAVLTEQLLIEQRYITGDFRSGGKLR
jgi:hypothetical protein